MADDLSIVVRARNEASAVLGQIGDQITGLGAIAGVAGAAMAAGLAAGVGMAIKSAAELEQAVANISTIKPEIDTSAVFSALNEMSTRVPQSATQLGDSLYNVFSSLDVSTEGALQLVETFAKGATGAGTDAETFGTAVVGVMNAYGKSVDEASHISDVFFNTVNAGVVSGKELAANLGPVTQSAKLAGVSLDQLGGMIAGVTKEGGPAAQNINNLNNLLMKISTKPAVDAFKSMGIASMDAAGNFRPVMDVLGDLKAQLSTMSQGEASQALQKIFPDAQARTAAATLMSQLDFVNGAIQTNVTSAGSAEAAYQKMSATAQSQFALMKNAGQAALNSLGQAFLPIISTIMTGLAGFTGPAIANVQNFAKVLGQVMQLLTTGDPEERIKIFNILSTMIGPELAERVALITSGIIGLFGALSGDQSGLERLQNALTGLFGGEVAAKVMEVGGAIGGMIGTVMQAVGSFVSWQDILTAIGVLLTAVAIPAVLGLIGTFAPLIAIFAAIVIASATLRAAWENDWGGIRTALTEAWTGTIQPALVELGGWLGERLPGFINDVKTGWTLLWQDAQPIIKTAGEFIGTQFTGIQTQIETFITVVQKIQTAFEELRTFLAGLNLPNPFAGLQSAANNVSDAVARAQGRTPTSPNAPVPSNPVEDVTTISPGGFGAAGTPPPGRQSGGAIRAGRAYRVHRDEVIFTRANGYVAAPGMATQNEPREIQLGNIIVNPIVDPEGKVDLQSFTDIVADVATQVAQMASDAYRNPAMQGI